MNIVTIKLRDVKETDWDFILELRNEKEYRKNFDDQHTISREEHYEYLSKQLNNPRFFNQIICDDERDVGYIRILDNDVSIIVDKKYHKKGVGTKALELIEPKAKEKGFRKLVGRILIHNEQSKRIFEKNGYDLRMWWLEKNLS